MGAGMVMARVRLGRVAGRIALAGSLLAICGLVTASPSRTAHAAGEHVLLATLSGTIDPITDSYIGRAVDEAVHGGANALIIALDTPGGLDTSMRSIDEHLLTAPVPVVVFVSPSGARAASAGLFVTEAADIAVMAPGTNIGSAHPIIVGAANPLPGPSAMPSSTGDVLSQKIENDAVAYVRALSDLHHRNADWAEQAVRQSVNVPVDEAVRLKVVDFESQDLGTLLSDLDGRQVVKQGRTYTLHTAGATVERIDLNAFDSLLQAVADPTIAYLLLLLAIVSVGLWIAHPGLVLPGVVGAVAAILAFVGLSNLPINLAGALLVVLGFVLFIIDIKAPTHGVLTTGGVVAMGMGGMLLIDTGFLDAGVNRAAVLGTTLVLAASFGFVVRKVVAARHRPFAIGQEGLVGAVGAVREPLAPEGLVFVAGALWRAMSGSLPLEQGAAVRVVRVEGLRLTVEPVDLTIQSDAATPSGVGSARGRRARSKRWWLRRRESWSPR